MSEVTRAELKYLVERQREEIKTLNEVGKLLSSSTDPQAIAQLATSYLTRTFPVALCGLLILPQKKLYLTPTASIPQVEVTTASRAIREAMGQLLNRAITEEESAGVLPAVHASEWGQPTTSLRSQLFTPLRAKGRLIGLLSLFSGKPEAFTTEDHHAVGIVSEQLGAALHNAVLVEELRRADQLKNQMLSIVSHELGTPLTAIKEGVNLVLDGTLGATTPDQQDFLKTVLENSERLERIVQKIKTATELMTGQTRFTFESFDLRTLVANVEKTYRALAHSHGVHVKVLDYPKPLFWSIDKASTTQALNELLENAIQATPKDGFVTMKLSLTTTEAQIEVTDSGCGIDKEALTTLFEQFKSIGEIHERKMGGLGMGLFIAKSLIEGQHGAISVESIVGQGTQIIVHLPKQPQPEVSS